MYANFFYRALYSWKNAAAACVYLLCLVQVCVQCKFVQCIVMQIDKLVLIFLMI